MVSRRLFETLVAEPLFGAAIPARAAAAFDPTFQTARMRARQKEEAEYD
jgi:hypothetical protein